MNELMNRIFNILAYVLLVAGLCGMIIFFAMYFTNTDQNFLFYCAMMSFVLGIALFTIYKRLAHLGMTQIIRSLDSVHQQVEMMNANFKAQHGAEEKETEPEEPKKN